MNNIDLQIREALNAEDAALAEEIEGEQTMLQMISDSFRGRHRSADPRRLSPEFG